MSPKLPPVDATENNPTVREVIDWYAINNPVKSKCKIAEHERKRVCALFVAEYGDWPCSVCRPHQMLDFINRHAGENAWTSKRWNATLQRPFNYAARVRFITLNPFRGVSFPKGDPGRDLTQEEYQTTLRHAQPLVRRIIVWLRFSGMRPGEATSLRWEEIKADTGTIAITHHETVTKTKRPRLVPINTVMAKLLCWIQRQQQHRPSEFVFLNSRREPWLNRALHKRFRILCRQAGLPASVKLHGLRHTFATGAILSGLDVATLAQILGHGTLVTTQGYLHMANKTDHLAAAMEMAVSKRKQESAR